MSKPRIPHLSLELGLIDDDLYAATRVRSSIAVGR